MKKVILSAGLAIIFMASCKENETADPAPTPPVVEDPAPPAAPEPRATTSSTTTTTTTTTSEENPDGTSVSIGRDGVDISTKDGDKSNNVKLSTRTKEVQVKTTE